jgi:serine/threonine-protein kinase
VSGRSSPDPERVARVFADAAERPPAERAAFLDTACRDAPQLRAELESLLAAHDRAAGFMDDLPTADAAALVGQANHEPRDGRRAGPYVLLEELGRGGQGVVYLAERVEGGFAQRAAIKLLKRGMDTDAILRRFLRERQILAGLQHVNVARLLDGGVTEDGQPYFAMEYVDGEALIEYCEHHGLPVEDRLRLFEDACRAVHHAHAQLVVHRDLKPSNMLVTGEGQLKLLDFGIAKLLADEGDTAATALTQADTRLLTPDYAAPEQVRGEPVTTATDVYALGVVLYELIAGQSPYGPGRRTVGESVRAVCEVEPRPPSSAAAAQPRLARRLRGDLDTVVLKALSKEPSRRYASAEALGDDIRRHLAGYPVLARRDTIGYVVTKFVRRHRVGVGAAALATLSLLAGLVGTAWQAAVAARERDRARQEAERAEKVKEFLVGLFKASDPVESRGEAVTAREILDRGTDRIEKDLAGHPALQADLFETVALISESLGRYDRARPLAERSVERARQAYGPDHPQVARAMDTLGWILHATGDYAAAEDLARQSLALHRRIFPPDDPQLAVSLDMLGVVLRDRAKLAEAELLHREALAIRRQRLGPEDRYTALSLSNLANVLYGKGDYAGAAEQQREAVRIQRKVLGERHPSVASSLVSLGAALVQDGDLPAAEAAQREALEIRTRVYGDAHPWVSESLLHLGATLQQQGRLAEAEKLFRQGLALDLKLKGPEHRDVAVDLMNLAHALAQQARFGEAMPLFGQAAALHRKVSGADHPLLARTLERQASALIDQGRAAEAVPLLDDCLAINRARYGPEHPTVATALGAYARAMAGQGRIEEAERRFHEALDIQRRVRPKPHLTTAEMLLGLGEMLVKEHRAREAEPRLREALNQAAASVPETHWRRGQIETALGASLLELGRPDQARPLLARGHERLRAALGEAHPATARARAELEKAPGAR